MSATGMSSRYSSRVSKDSRTLSIAYGVADDVLGGDERERVADVVREVVARADGVGVDDRVVVAAEDEERERGGVAPDRRLGLGGAELERPARGLLGCGPVSGEDERLHRADRTAPAPGRRVGDALAVALGRAVEPLGRLVAVALP